MTQNFNRGTKKTIMRIEHDIPNKALDQFKYPSNFNKSENLWKQTSKYKIKPKQIYQIIIFIENLKQVRHIRLLPRKSMIN